MAIQIQWPKCPKHSDYCFYEQSWFSRLINSSFKPDKKIIFEPTDMQNHFPLQNRQTCCSTATKSWTPRELPDKNKCTKEGRLYQVNFTIFLRIFFIHISQPRSWRIGENGWKWWSVFEKFENGTSENISYNIPERVPSGNSQHTVLMSFYLPTVALALLPSKQASNLILIIDPEIAETLL